MSRGIGTRNWESWIVLVTAISTLIQLVGIAIQDRKRKTKTLLGEAPTGRRSVGIRRQRKVWRKHMNKQLVFCYAVFCELAISSQREIQCPWYIKPRTVHWYHFFLDYSPHRDPERFQQFFRVSPDLFEIICNLVREDLLTDPPEALALLPNRELVVERQVAVAIRRLATGDSVLGISELFGISASSTSKVTWKFIQSFNHRARHYLSWPIGRELDEVKAGFSSWGFPNCCGAIDCTHFLIELPVGEHAADYYDWKHNYSVTMQAVVDHHGKFLDVYIGCPGSTADACLLRMSGLFQDVVYEGTKLHGLQVYNQEGQGFGEYLLGDGGYPLYRWLMVPFPRNANPEFDMWNHLHSSARMVVERSFGKLKGVWRILSRQILRPKVDRLASMIFTCVLLHNMQVAHGDNPNLPMWADMPPHPPGYGRHQRPTTAYFEGGMEAKEALYVQVMNARGQL